MFDPATGTFGTVRSETDITMPQSVNLDFQTGVTAKTLLYGSVRWADWEGWSVAPEGFVSLTGEPLVEFEHDTWRYQLGSGGSSPSGSPGRSRWCTRRRPATSRRR